LSRCAHDLEQSITVKQILEELLQLFLVTLQALLEVVDYKQHLLVLQKLDDFVLHDRVVCLDLDSWVV
jgi:hypothetical protein